MRPPGPGRSHPTCRDRRDTRCSQGPIPVDSRVTMPWRVVRGAARRVCVRRSPAALAIRVRRAAAHPSQARSSLRGSAKQSAQPASESVCSASIRVSLLGQHPSQSARPASESVCSSSIRVSLLVSASASRQAARLEPEPPAPDLRPRHGRCEAGVGLRSTRTASVVRGTVLLLLTVADSLCRAGHCAAAADCGGQPLSCGALCCCC